MTTEEFSVFLDRREIGNEISEQEEKIAKDNDLVVVFGASDDLMLFRGAIYGEVSCYDGGIAYLDETGLHQNECDEENCPYFEKIKEDARMIEAVWCEREPTSWTYKTDITHSTFRIYEDGVVWCVGIIFRLDHLNTYTC